MTGMMRTVAAAVTTAMMTRATDVVRDMVVRRPLRGCHLLVAPP
jgi:hypothetical protein